MASQKKSPSLRPSVPPSHFTDRLIARIQAKGTSICVGLDPRLDQMPPSLTKRIFNERGNSFEAASEAIVEFNKGIIDSVHDLVPAVKPQLAFYMPYGSAGISAFEHTCRYAQEKGLIVIADAKVNDIGSTAESYAKSFLGKVPLLKAETESPFACDAVTVNPYLGYDGIKPFIEICRKNGKGIFVLVKTSNASSGDIQDRGADDGLKNYEIVAHLLESWGADDIGENGYSSIGAVVGATHPEHAKRLREIMPHTFFLMPGYGAQGGSADTIKKCLDADGLGALVNSSREIIFAWQKEKSEKDYGEAARAAVQKMKADLA